jgi:hypothetical protein
MIRWSFAARPYYVIVIREASRGILTVVVVDLHLIEVKTDRHINELMRIDPDWHCKVHSVVS